jgi:hypothetical protein
VGHYCPGAYASPQNQLIPCPLGTYSPTVAAKSPLQCQPCAQNSYCPVASLQLPCPSGTVSNASSTSQLQCSCAKGYQCSYTKVVQAVITLLMGLDDFNLNPAVRAAFINAVASSAKTAPSNVAIISVRDTLTGQTQAGRRLLQAQKRMEQAAAGAAAGVDTEDPKIHVSLQVDHATELRDLNLHLFASGLEPSYDHVFYAPHKVVAAPE